MSSRSEILSRLRGDKGPMVPRPGLANTWQTWDHPVDQFMESLKGVGGYPVEISDQSELLEALDGLEVFREADTVLSSSVHVPVNGIGLEDVTDPHDLEHVDLYIADGLLGVAENGAVWITDAQTHHQAALFITQHLVLTVQAADIVNNMHEAYEKPVRRVHIRPIEDSRY